jgi:4-carboxymuconolactone decarboxylase
MEHNEVSDQVFEEAIRYFGQPGVVELTAIVGYFIMVCWFLNVAGTPAPSDTTVAPLKLA